MTNTKFRKRALLSSVAMLLVALVALGSATFAWFAANPDAKASGLSMKTTASTGLVIRTDSDDAWSHDAKLDKNGTDAFNLQPVSEEQTTAANFWKVGAASAEAYGAGTDNMQTGSVGGYAGPGTEKVNADVYAEKIYFRLSDGSNAADAATKKVQLNNIAITGVSGATLSSAIRVAIAKNDGTLIATYATQTTGANGTLTTAGKTAGEFTKLETVGAKSEQVSFAPLSATATDLTNYITVYVYLDGQDTECYSDNVGTVNAAQIISGIQLDFKLVD